MKKEIPQKEAALESSSPNYKTLGAIVCATAAVLYAVYKYYPRRQQEEYHITKPLDYDVMNIWNVPSWHELEPHQQNSRTIAHPESKFDHNPFAFSDAVKKGQGFVYTLYNEVVEGWGCLINIKENTTPTKEGAGIRYGKEWTPL